MSQHSLAIANEAGAAFRSDVNSGLQALASQSSGATAPSTMYAYMRWADTTNGVVKRRNAANSAWVLDGTLTETYAVARSSNTILALADRGKYFRATATFTQTLTAAATLGDGWACEYRIDSGVTITFDPNSTEQIDGATTKAITGPAGGVIFCDGSNFFTYGFGITSISAANLATSAMGASNTLINGTLVHSRAASAETIAIKTLAGADPSASDPVYVVFRNATVTTGDYAVITLTAATSITISSGSTMGFTSSVAARIWVVGFNDAGTFRLGVINCLSTAAGAGAGRDVTAIYPLQGWGIASSTAEGGAGAADSAQVFYTGTAVTSKAYVPLGYSTWESGLGTAGTWGTAPTRTQLYGPGVPLPGQLIQSLRNDTGAVATGTTVVPYDDTIPQITEGDQYLTQAITPTSGANALRITANLMAAVSAQYDVVSTCIFQDATANAIAVLTSAMGANASAAVGGQLLDKMLLSSTTSSTTLRVRAGPTTGTLTVNGSAGGRKYGGVAHSFLEVAEIMA